jgi:hypothetical protein
MAAVRLSAPGGAIALSARFGRVIAGTLAGEVLRFDLRGMTMGCGESGAAGNAQEIGKAIN